MSRYVGIDFGTTNSAIVEYSPANKIKPFRNIGDEDGSPIPSVISIDYLTNQINYGREAKNKLMKYHSTGDVLVVQSVKTALASGKTWSTGARIWTEEEIATTLLKKLSEKYRETSAQKLPIREAVIAIPVGFPQNKRKLLRKAANEAHITISTFVSEPTAAFIAHSKELKHCRYVAVFDWGGGTLDISILEINDGCIIERQTANWLVAGDEIDRRFAEWIHQKIIKEDGILTPFDSVPTKEKQILLNEAENHKKQLQEEKDTEVSLLNYLKKPRSLVVTQTDFNALIQPIVERAIELLIQSIEGAHISVNEIGKLIVVGGSSKLQLLQDMIHEKWLSPDILFPENADWDVAKGAAILAANPGCYRLAEHIGLVLADDQFHSIFKTRTDASEANLKLHLGLVEEAESATFVFATQDPGTSLVQTIDEYSVDVFGFKNEVIELRSFITPDLSFISRAVSGSKPRTLDHFEYNKLKWMYQIPDQI